MTDLNEIYNCYYCWHSDVLARFKIFVKEGHTNRCKCPECGLALNYIILTRFTTGDKARWLYLNIRRYRGKHFNFFDNIQFDKIKFRLYGYEKKDFWDNWKYIKENYDTAGADEMKRLYRILTDKAVNQQNLLSYTDAVKDGVKP